MSLLLACFAYACSLGILPLPDGIPPAAGDPQARLCLYAKTGIMCTMSKDTDITKSTGNVFADLGLPDAEEALAKAEIASQICDIIVRRRLTQSKAAAILGIDQPKVSALMRGRLEGFSSERLFRFLNALGRDVEIMIKPKPPGTKRGKIRVLTGQA
jgi:predicted XRE-type DNA-binding protein